MPPDIRKKPRSCLFGVLLALFGALTALGVAGMFAVWSDVFAGDTESVDAPGAEPAAANQDAASGESTSDVDEPTNAPEGPISGTWIMYWTNSEGNESPAFTIIFEGTDTGTLEILNDDTEFDTAFKVEGDRVEFEFTRIMHTDIASVDEESIFLGTLTGADLIVGEWGRQDWECWPDPDAGCRTTPNWPGFPARLVRQ